MGKIDDYNLSGLKRGKIAQLNEFKDELREIVNYGKIAYPVVSAVPAWNAGEGEMAFFNQVTPATDRRIYVRLYSSWVVFSQILGSGSGPGATLPGGVDTNVQVNSSNNFYGENQFVWNIANKYLFINSSLQGRYTPLVLVNSQGAVASNLSSSTVVRFGFGSTTDNALIEVGKINDYTSTSLENSFMDFYTDSAGTLRRISRITPNKVLIGTTNDAVLGPTFYVQGIGDGGTSGQREFLARFDDPFGTPLLTMESFTPRVIIGDSTNAASNVSLTLRGGNAAANLFLEGGDNDSNAGISFGVANVTTGNQVDCQIYNAIHSEALNIPSGVYSSYGYLGISYTRSTKPGFLVFQNGNILTPNLGSMVSEDPLTLFYPQSITYANAVNLINHRQNIFRFPSILGGTAGAVVSVSYAATVYIEGPPDKGANSSAIGTANLLNSYALWVDNGPVRIDGDLITGGATTNTKASGIVFTTSGIHVSSNSTTENELIRAIVGTTSLVANTLSEGRTIRLSAIGYYNSPATPGTMIMNVKLGGATILSTSNQTVTGNASTFGWSLESLITCQTTGGAGTVFGQGRFDNNSSATAMNRWQMVGSSTVTLNTTGANIVELTCQWGTANAASQLFCTNCVGELLN